MSAHNQDGSSGHSRGVTLVELIISMGISVAVLAMAFGIFAYLSGALSTQQKVTDSQLEQFEAFSTLETDIRNAGADPLAAAPYKGGVYPVEIIPSDQPMAGGLRLRTDFTGTSGVPDGDLDDVGEQIVYQWNSSTGVLSRSVATGTGDMVTSPLLAQATLFTAELLDRNGTAATPETATQVRITFATSIDPHISQGVEGVRRESFTLLLPNVMLTGVGNL
jgi:Tfp pilus assembly protein PilW